MKRTILLCGLILMSFTQLISQQQPQNLPIDPKVRLGKLDNGLTYYIRHNELPKERAEFFIAQNVGSILEEDDQNGLAHFLEHMAFNGTKNYPGKNLINYLETIGVKFGANLNAYTSWDQTVYNISDVPVTRSEIIDSCLLILHDWSNSLLLEDAEIDKERGVIREEMRSRGGSEWRLMEKLLPQVLPGNQYSKRNIIGTEEIIMNFAPQTLRDYYHKWYRPDLQAIIIVGDIDVDDIENRIKTIFADIPAPVNPAERIYYQVEDNEEPLIAIATDKEATSTGISVYFKHKPIPKEARGSIMGFVTGYFNSVITNMLNTRLRELREKPDCPFIGANTSNSKYINTITEEAMTIGANVKENQIENTLKTLVREMQRALRFGFTDSEYDRIRINIITQYESAVKEKDKTRNKNYVQGYINHFSQNTPIPGIEMEYNILSSIAPQIPVEQVNQYFQTLVGDKNIVIILEAPEKEEIIIPEKEQLLSWFNEAKAEELQPYEDKVSNEPLMKELPEGGSIVSEEKDDRFGTVNYTLSNGVKVVIKPTTFKEDEILMSSTSPGGNSHFPDSEFANLKLYDAVSSLGGLGNFSQVDLSKALTGKKVSLSASMGLTWEGIGGSSTPKDFETLLQLTYLYFTAPRVDEEAYQAFINRTRSALENQQAAPEIALVDTLSKALYINQARNSRFKLEDLDKVNYQTIMNWRKDRYADASDFTFIFTGNIQPEESKGLIAKYLGALPSINRTESFVPVNINYNSGTIKKDFDKQMDNPKATVIDIFWGIASTDMSTRLKMSILQQVLTLIYTEKVREEEGGTYGVSVNGNISDYPKGRATLEISFETEPTKKSHLNEIIYNELRQLIENGPKPEDFQKTKEFMLKSHQERMQENGYWNSVITSYYRLGYDSYTNYVDTVNAITPDDIRLLAKMLTEQGNLIEVIMTGVK
ncbi:MAG: insulinase family protein [Dysgonamonadaceae bacterium]|nr:insulinase family protein [Dysgonamonadaceae bacterium]